MQENKFYIAKILENIENKNQCWLWKRAKSSEGYGNIWIEGKCKKAHRVSYTYFKGAIPEGLCVCHSCDEPSCVNPDHLWVGTHKENMNDMVRKRRTLYAEQRSNNKITSTMKPEIFNKYSTGKTMLELAKEYNVSESTILNSLRSIMPNMKISKKGENHPGAKLKDDDIINIRLSHEDKKVLAKKYTVTVQAINSIRARRTWKHI